MATHWKAGQAYYRNVPHKWYGFTPDLTTDWFGIIIMVLGFVVLANIGLLTADISDFIKVKNSNRCLIHIQRVYDQKKTGA